MPTAEPEARTTPLADRSFAWLTGGGAVSMLGDQFTLVALPWLVLKLTGSATALGATLALMSVPRAIFILVGGALVDRYSSKHVLVLTKYVNAALLASLAALVYTQGVRMWLLYPLAVAIGLASAFSYPAGTAIIPQVVRPEHLHAANAFFMMLRQIILFAGPAAAGGFIAVVPGPKNASAGLPDAHGLGLAFGVDAFSFLFSAWTLTRVSLRQDAVAARPPDGESLWRNIREGVTTFWRDAQARTLLVYYAAIGFFVAGPFQVGLPLLVEKQLHGGAGAFGGVLAAFGLGSLVGMGISAARPGLAAARLGVAIAAVDATVGVLIVALGFTEKAFGAALCCMAAGALGGFVQVAVYTWFQRRIAPAMLGRAMALLMFVFMGVAPLATALAGIVLDHATIRTLFTGAGGLLTLLAFGAFLHPAIRTITAAPAPAAEGAA